MAINMRLITVVLGLAMVLLLVTSIPSVVSYSATEIQGYVTDSNGKPIETKMHVLRDDEQLTYMGNISSNNQGIFTVGKLYDNKVLPDGKYFIQAYPDMTSEDGFLIKHPFVINNGEVAEGKIHVKLPKAQVSGLVINPHTGGLADPEFAAMLYKGVGKNEKFVAYLHIYDNGKFSFGNLEDGDYSIVAVPSDAIKNHYKNSEHYNFKIANGKYLGSKIELIPSKIPNVKTDDAPNQIKSNRPATVFYVALNGNDNKGKGTLASPWRTIAKASKSMKAGDTCVIRAGTYRETLRPLASGVAGKPITYKAYKSERVVISGADPITGFVRAEGNIYVTDMPWNLGSDNQLLCKSETLWEARWPNLESFSMQGFNTSMARVDEGSPLSIIDSEFDQSDDYWVNATVWCRGGSILNGWDAWLAQTSRVTGYSQNEQKITFNRFYHSYKAADPHENNDYYLFGLKSLLDAPSEWYADVDERNLYVIASDGKVPTGMELKKRMNAIDISDKNFIVLEGLETLAGNVKTDNANDCVLNRMKMKWLNYSFECSEAYRSQFRNGINLSGNNNEIKNSEIAYTTGSAILIEGTKNRVVNNNIHDIGYSSNYGSPVYLAGSNNLISHNTIKNSARFAIGLGGDSSKSYAESVVEYNDISEFMMLSADAGAIYAFGTDGGNTRIHHNRIYNSGNHYNSKAIQLESYARNFIIDHNVIYNIDALPFGFDKPVNYNFVYNNSFFNTHRNKEYWGLPTRFINYVHPSQTLFYDDEIQRVRIQNNLMSETEDPILHNGTLVFNHNIEINGASNFVDPANGDFQLKKNAAAIDQGVVVPGITDGFIGSAPDIGAYEFGAPIWPVGCNFVTLPNPQYILPETRFMNRLKNSGFEMVKGVSNGVSITADLENWINTGNNSARVAKANQESDSWKTRGLDKKLVLMNGMDGVEQKVTGLKPNTRYELVGWTYVEPDQTISWGVKGYGGEEKTITSRSTMYKRDVIVFTTGKDSTSARVYITKTSSGSGFVYADDFGLVELE